MTYASSLHAEDAPVFDGRNYHAIRASCHEKAQALADALKNEDCRIAEIATLKDDLLKEIAALRERAFVIFGGRR